MRRREGNNRARARPKTIWASNSTQRRDNRRENLKAGTLSVAGGKGVAGSFGYRVDHSERVIRIRDKGYRTNVRAIAWVGGAWERRKVGKWESGCVQSVCLAWEKRFTGSLTGFGWANEVIGFRSFEIL